MAKKKATQRKATQKKAAKKKTSQRASSSRRAGSKRKKKSKSGSRRTKSSANARSRSKASVESDAWVAEMRKANPHLVEFEGWDQDQETGELPELEQLDPHTQGLELDDDWYQARDEICDRLGGPEGIREAILSTESSYQSMGRANIQGIGIGVKECCGHITGDICVKVFVREKLPMSKVHRSAKIPSQLPGITTDVEPVHEFRASLFTLRDRPRARCGVSISHPSVGAGSMGALVELNNGKLALLSNNHVIANENNAVVNQSRILQPGVRDGGNFHSDGVALLERFIPLNFGGTNLLDAAVAHTNFSLVSPTHFTYQLNPQPVAATAMMFVIKNGRSTQGTGGMISAIGVNNMAVSYRSGTAFFDDQIVVKGLQRQAFSLDGDSGALVVSALTKQPVGLLFAGSPQQSLVTPIATVMQKLGIRRFIAPA